MSSAVKARVFRARLVGTLDEIRVKATLLVNGITFKLYELIVGAEEHRVDTGRMRAGWAIAVEAPGEWAPDKVDREVQSQRQAARRRGEDPEPLFEIPNGEIFLATITGAPLTSKRIIFNNVEYAVWVEEGTETMEGQHVVKLAVQRLGSGRVPIQVSGVG